MTTYHFKDPTRGLIGPIGLRAACELIDSGAVGRDALVSCDGGSFEALSDVEALRTAIDTTYVPSPTLSGDVAKEAVVGLIFRLFRTHETGLLVIKDGQARKDLYLRDGKPIFLSSNVPSERFGQFLVLRKKVDEQDLAVALDAMKTDNYRLGETLVRLGLLEVEELFEELRCHQKERLIELCCWQTGTYEYFQGRVFPGDEPDLRLTAPELVLEVVREMPMEMLIPRLLRRQSLAPHLTEDDVVQSIPFAHLELRVVKSIDGGHTISEIIALASADEAERLTAHRVLFLLAEIEALAFGATS